MLKVTSEAASVLASARESSGQPDDFGARLFLEGGQEATPRLALSFVPDPEPDDDVNRDERIPVFIAPEVAQVVGESTLDAEKTEAGSAQLVIRR